VSLFDKLSDTLLARSRQVRNRSLLDAAMATSALVATADGEVSFAARHRVDEVLENVDALTAFDVHTAIDVFMAFVDDVRNRPEDGGLRALRAVSAVAGNAEDARVVLRIACAVGRANGGYSPQSIARIRETAEALGLATPDFDDGNGLQAAGNSGKAYRIAVGNQKGGTGKSTTALHLAIGLLRNGHRVACIDLDGRQGTLTHYLANRRAYAESSDRDIPVPLHTCIEPVDADDRKVAEREETARLNEALAAYADCDFIVLDTPGSHDHLARLGLVNADALITPLNDSFLDIDVLARVDPHKRLVLGPSAYAKMVMQQSENRVARGRQPIHWIVMRNRMAQLDARNTREMTKLLDLLSERMGFRLHPGFSERVVYRELFFSGLTPLDLPHVANEVRVNPSHWNARQEVRQLVEAVDALHVPA
jgi:chromosome partitioning protein